MARYKVSHKYMCENNWLGRTENGGWGWVAYEKAEKFQNWFKAKEAFATLPIEKLLYGEIHKPNYMKVEYTEAEKALPGNEWMRDTKPLR